MGRRHTFFCKRAAVGGMFPSRPGSTQQYTNNIYGYAYDAPSRSGPQIVRGQTAQSTNTYQPTTTTNRGTASAPYQSVADLKTTRLRDPSVLNSYSSPTSSSGGSSQAMFYPYRTETQTVYGTNQAGSTQFTGDQFSSGTLFRDANTDPCSLPDPYWCSDYVKIYLSSSTTLNGLNQQTACQLMIQSLQDSYNGCCQTLRAAGCR
ncbi:hypothetical protein Y032_0042g573 [Ancylostoma ceylanicum]|uniref:Uncharacterized protein n=1 Tax=Ancylostoma ceylanicum TaxID=53326 RepID=A0A016UEX5_9BILA|nr:hypothetical protein Y032_0042g573 [Ancylostoma ceylanicum]